MSDMGLNYFTFPDDEFTCSRCQWKGKGRALTISNFSEEHSIADVSCPQCFKPMGFWQAPTFEEVDAWKLAHPEWKGE